MPTKFLLLAALLILTAVFLIIWLVAVRRTHPRGAVAPSARQLGIGFVTNFWDTFGIGSFATTTAAFKFWKIVRDEQIPGT